MERVPVWVLLSGGLDSAACTCFFSERGHPTKALFLDYGQPAAPQELAASSAIARHFGTPLTAIRCEGACPKGTGLIAGRNAFLLLAALLETGVDARIISIGVHAGTVYSDCSDQFLAGIQVIFDTYTDGRARVSAPFVRWQKADIWEYANAHGVPVNLTYSCERGGEAPCGRCRSCRDLEVLRAAG